MLKLASEWQEDAKALLRVAESAPSGAPARCGVTSVEWGESAVCRIVRAAGDAKDHERVGLTFVPTHQDGTAISTIPFDRRIKRFQHWRRLGNRFNDKRRRNDLEGLLRHGFHPVPNGQPDGARHQLFKVHSIAMQP